MAPEAPKSGPAQSNDQQNKQPEFNDKLDYSQDTQAKLAQIEASTASPEQKSAAKEQLKALLSNTDGRLAKATDQTHQKLKQSFE